MKYALGERTWPTKGAAKADFQRILQATPIGAWLHGEDKALITSLLELGSHPTAAEKIGPGIAEITVRPMQRGQRCFWVIRTDGTEVDFSYLAAMNGRSHEADVRAALREEIADQIRAFRDLAAVQDGLCELCGKPIDDEPHVDHAEPTFAVLAECLAEVAGGWSRVEVECPGHYNRRLKDRRLAESWQQFHQQAARLRLVHAGCNLSRKRGQ